LTIPRTAFTKAHKLNKLFWNIRPCKFMYLPSYFLMNYQVHFLFQLQIINEFFGKLIMMSKTLALVTRNFIIWRTIAENGD